MDHDEKKKKIDLPSGVVVEFNNPLRRKFYFDNDLENYPLSEGDLINIRTEKDYSQEVNPLTRKEYIPSFFFTFFIELDPL